MELTLKQILAIIVKELWNYDSDYHGNSRHDSQSCDLCRLYRALDFDELTIKEDPQ